MNSMYEAKARAWGLVQSGYSVDEAVDYVIIYHDLDEFQAEDLHRIISLKFFRNNC